MIDRENLSFYDTGYQYSGDGIAIGADGVTVTGNTVRNNVEGMKPNELLNGRGITVDGQNNIISNNDVSYPYDQKLFLK